MCFCGPVMTGCSRGGGTRDRVGYRFVVGATGAGLSRVTGARWGCACSDSFCPGSKSKGSGTSLAFICPLSGWLGVFPREGAPSLTVTWSLVVTFSFGLPHSRCWEFCTPFVMGANCGLSCVRSHSRFLPPVPISNGTPKFVSGRTARGGGMERARVSAHQRPH